MRLHVRRGKIRVMAAGAALTLALAACAGDDDTSDGDGDGDDPGDSEDGDAVEEPTGEGFDDCLENLNSCNSGDRADGGSISWILQQQIPGWLAISSANGDVYTLQTIHGILPNTGHWLPDATTYEYNMDLLTEEPVLLSDGNGDEPFSYQFQIREEAEWDDGTPITAEDFRVLWLMSASPDEGLCVGCDSRSSAGADQIESIEGSDNGKTVIITLKEGNRDPEWFGYGNVDSITGGLPPAHLAEANGWDIDDPEDLGAYFEWLHTTVPEYSGGPYRIVEGDIENQVIKEPNPNWYGEVSPTLDTLIIRFLTDQASWPAAVANGEAHGGNPVQLDQDLVQQFQEMPEVMVNVGPGPGWEVVYFNLDVPALDDASLRRAIFTAINTVDIAERNFSDLYPEYTLRTHPAFGVESPYYEDYLTGTGQGSGDTGAALEILEGAGYEFDGTALTLDGAPVGPFRLRTTDDPLRQTSVQLIQAQLGEIGIEIELDTIPPGQLGAVLGEQDFDLAQFGWSGSPAFAGNATQYFNTEINSNWGKYSDDEVDELGLAALNAANLDEAAEFTNQAWQVVVEDSYILPLWDQPVYIYVTNEFINVRDNQATSLRGQYNHHEWGVTVQ